MPDLRVADKAVPPIAVSIPTDLEGGTRLVAYALSDWSIFASVKTTRIGRWAVVHHTRLGLVPVPKTSPTVSDATPLSSLH